MGEYADWTIDTYLLAAIADRVGVANWQRTEDGTKKNPKHFPKPILRPGQTEEPAAHSSVDETHIGGPSMTLEELEAWRERMVGGDDVRPSNLPPRTSKFSRARSASKPTSEKSSPQSKGSRPRKGKPPAAP